MSKVNVYRLALSRLATNPILIPPGCKLCTKVQNCKVENIFAACQLAEVHCLPRSVPVHVKV